MASVLCISGLDPSGHSGISSDLRALDHLGVRSFPVISALTVQNGRVFSELHPVPRSIIEKQLNCVFESEAPNAVKLGILGSSEIATLISEYFDGTDIPIVTDPVFVSSTGFSVVDDDITDIYKNDIFPLTALATPNAMEASALTGISVESPGDARTACRMIRDMGPKCVLIKGGHFRESRGTDVYFDGSEFMALESEGAAADVRGTGCAYSSLIAGYLSLGLSMPEAIRNAKENMTAAIKRSAANRDPILRFSDRPKGRGGR